jgi:hypothetical protein
LFQKPFCSILFGTKEAKRKLPILKERWFDIASSWLEGWSSWDIKNLLDWSKNLKIAKMRRAGAEGKLTYKKSDVQNLVTLTL